MPVQIDTAMGAWFSGEKIAPEEAAIGILDAVEAGEVEAFPGRLSQDMASAFKADPEALQAQLAQSLPRLVAARQCQPKRCKKTPRGRNRPSRSEPRSRQRQDVWLIWTFNTQF